VTIARICILLFAALLAAGCTTTSAGEPTPATNTSPEGEQTRPREILLDDLDPCSMLSQDDYDEYRVEEAGEPDENDQGNKRCYWQSEIGFMSVTLVTHEGIEAQQERTNPIEPADPIENFPTYTVTLSDVDNSCFTAVDVADGQYLFVQAGVYSSAEGASPCEYSHQFAGSVMSTLVS
jgi:hypothetical protein